MNREEKAQLVDLFKDTFDGSNIVVVTHYRGLSVEEMTNLRQEMYDAGATYRVTKNTLAKIALEDSKYNYLADYFAGPTGVAVSEDPVAAAKVAVDFANENDNFEIIAGGMDEEELSIDRIEALAALPSMDELRAKLISMITTPAQRLATITQKPAGNIAQVLSAHAKANE